MSESLKRISDFRINTLKELLIQCKPEQINLFNRMYGSIETIEDEKIDRAIQQCERTIIKNNKIT